MTLRELQFLFNTMHRQYLKMILQCLVRSMLNQLISSCGSFNVYDSFPWLFVNWLGLAGGAGTRFLAVLCPSRCLHLTLLPALLCHTSYRAL